MKQTLLDMTQEILSSLSSDEVNSISDTPESLQVARIIKRKYYDILSRTDMPEHQQLFQLNASTDSTLPVIMYVPDYVTDVKWLKYYDTNSLDGNTATDFAHDLNTDITPNSGSGAPRWSSLSTTSNSVTTGTKTFTVSTGLNIAIGDTATATTSSNIWMSGTVTSYTSATGVLILNITATNGLGTYNTWNIVQGNVLPSGPGYLYVSLLANDEFINMVGSFNLQDQGILSYTLADISNNFDANFTLYYKNNKQPDYATIISNNYVLFDSFDSTQDSTLQASKTMVFGTVRPEWQMTDTFVPDLAQETFPLLVNEAKELAFFELRQQSHPLADREIHRGWSAVQKKKSLANRPTYFDELPGFGRKRGYYGYRGSYFSGINDKYNARGGLY